MLVSFIINPFTLLSLCFYAVDFLLSPNAEPIP